MAISAIRPLGRGILYRTATSAALADSAVVNLHGLAEQGINRINRITPLQPRQRDRLMRGNATREANLRSWIATRPGGAGEFAAASGRDTVIADATVAPASVTRRPVILPLSKKLLHVPARRRAIGLRGKTSRTDIQTDFDNITPDKNQNPVEHTAATGEISPYQRIPVGAPTAKGYAAPAPAMPPFAEHGKAWQQRLIANLAV